ncbi:MAG: multiprotein-bridging factor 1 family protein [Alphaproteobacteria bacterium]
MRAARGLLDWSQADLARHAGLSVTAMNNIDRGLSTPRTATASHIQKVFENHGVEFIEGNGVRFRHDVFKIETYQGPKGFETYLRDILDIQIAKGVESLHQSYEEPNFLAKHRKPLMEFYQTLEKHKLKERTLILEGVTERFGPPWTSDFRWCPRELSGRVGYSLYGDRYYIFLKDRIVAIENADLADAYRKQFEAAWKTARKPQLSESLYERELKKAAAKGR